jgi:phosphocarrier protein HPr
MAADNAHAAPSADSLSRTATICNQRGLHARAAAKFVKLAGQFTADVTVTKGETTVSGTSIMGLMMLAAGPGCDIELKATGPQAQAALTALAFLIERGFDEG